MIIYKANIFDRTQTIHVITDRKTIKTYKDIPFDDVGKTIVNYCYIHNDFSVKIIGPSNYSAKIRDKILAQNTLCYQDQHTIEVEI